MKKLLGLLLILLITCCDQLGTKTFSGVTLEFYFLNDSGDEVLAKTKSDIPKNSSLQTELTNFLDIEYPKKYDDLFLRSSILDIKKSNVKSLDIINKMPKLKGVSFFNCGINLTEKLPASKMKIVNLVKCHSTNWSKSCHILQNSSCKVINFLNCDKELIMKELMKSDDYGDLNIYFAGKAVWKNGQWTDEKKK